MYAILTAACLYSVPLANKRTNVVNLEHLTIDTHICGLYYYDASNDVTHDVT